MTQAGRTAQSYVSTDHLLGGQHASRGSQQGTPDLNININVREDFTDYTAEDLRSLSPSSSKFFSSRSGTGNLFVV
jgi:hypothetical protein